MYGSYKLIDSYWDVLDNVLQFNYDLQFDSELSLRLNQFRSWYYIPELDQFGPSQFVGYKGMNAAEYKRAHLNGEVTERVLGKFFRPIQRSNPNREMLESKLSDLCSRYEKTPNKTHRINIPRNSVYDYYDIVLNYHEEDSSLPKTHFIFLLDEARQLNLEISVQLPILPWWTRMP